MSLTPIGPIVSTVLESPAHLVPMRSLFFVHLLTRVSVWAHYLTIPYYSHQLRLSTMAGLVSGTVSV